MKRAIVVGSGAGGATVAKELQGRFDVTILEAGNDFRPFMLTLPRLEQLKQTGLLFDAREAQLFFPNMKIRKTKEGMILVSGMGLGGTTTIATGNALRMDGPLKEIGIDLDAEFAEAYQEIPVGTAHQRGWYEMTQHLFEVCQALGFDPQPTPKLGNYDHCRHCGRCVFGCPWDAKWDSRAFVKLALERGADLVTGCKVERVIIRDGQAVGVEAHKGWASRFIPADLVVLAAGGLATPIILQNSGFTCEPSLFVDPVLCVAAEARNCRQCFDIEMPFIVQREGYILSPYFDYLSFLFNRAWRYPAKDIVAIMIKLADSNVGNLSKRGIDKPLDAKDKKRLAQGVEISTEILYHFGVKKGSTFLGTLNAGHPGGMLPFTEREAKTLHHEQLPENLYLADTTLFPRSLGNPPILTIVAMAKRISKLCLEKLP